MAFHHTSRKQDLAHAWNVQRSPLFAPLLIAAITFGVAGWAATSGAQTGLPTDAQPLCDDGAEIKSWFDQNGFVEPPDNRHFDEARAAGGTVRNSQEGCIFFETSARMFLWLTSTYRQLGDEPVYMYDSPLFYRVGPPDKHGYRPLIKNHGMRIVNVDDKSARSFGPSISQLGPVNVPVVFDEEGGMHAFVRRVINRNGGLDACSNSVPPARDHSRTGTSSARLSCPGESFRAPGIPATASRARLYADGGQPIRTDIVNGITVYFDSNGNAIPSTPGQVCDKILISRDNRIVYYNMSVNDVYAYFVSGTKQNKFHFKRFPTATAVGKTDDITEISDFAKSHHAELLDKKALAIELKTAWIEIDDGDKERFVTTWATVPTFDRSDATHWMADGWKKVHLGLVGMHIVFSARNNPAMIWATFEHVDNAPDEEYEYCQRSEDPDCKRVTQGRDASTNWLFSTNNSLSASNQQLAYLYKGDICGYDNNAIGANNILRKNAWGSAIGSHVAPQQNTEIINVNGNVLDSLPAGDVRRHYVLIGSMWTHGGFPPGAPSLGGQRLANTTMETFFQESNCFECHRDKTATVKMSHIFVHLQSLFARRRTN